MQSQQRESESFFFLNVVLLFGLFFFSLSSSLIVAVASGYIFEKNGLVIGPGFVLCIRERDNGPLRRIKWPRFFLGRHDDVASAEQKKSEMKYRNSLLATDCSGSSDRARYVIIQSYSCRFF